MAAAGTVEFWKLWEGRVVDKAFPLLRCLGGGATSAVFLTEAAGEKGRRAALRLVRAGAPGAELQLSRWQRAAKLSHPNLIRLLNMGRSQLDDTPMLYLVMEYAEENLSQVVPERALTEEETGHMLKPVLGALQYIHRQGFVHGHVKPANIMAIDDQIKLSSDSLWIVAGRGEHRSTPGPYDPPEISLRGTSPAGDIWSLGVTLIEVLTQRPQQTVPEGLPETFTDIAQHCLQTDPQNRWTLDQISARLSGNPVPEAAPRQEMPPEPRAVRPAAAAGRSIAPSSLLTNSLTSSPASDEIPPQAKSRRGLYIGGLAALLIIGLLAARQFRSEPSSPAAASPVVVTPTVTSPPQAAPDPVATAPAPKTPTQEKPSPKTKTPEAKAPESPTETAKVEEVPAEKIKPRPVETRPMVDGEILDQVMPTGTPHARDSVHGKFTVDVRVHVNPAGSVTDAKLEVHGPSRYFANLSVESARKWKFKPTETPQDWLLRFKFERANVSVLANHVSP